MPLFGSQRRILGPDTWGTYHLYAVPNPFVHWQGEEACQFAAHAYDQAIRENAREARNFEGDIRGLEIVIKDEKDFLASLREERARVSGSGVYAAKRRAELAAQIRAQEDAVQEVFKDLEGSRLSKSVLYEQIGWLQLKKEGLVWLLSSAYPVQATYSGTDPVVRDFRKRLLARSKGFRFLGFYGLEKMGPIDRRVAQRERVARVFRELVQSSHIGGRANPLFALYVSEQERVKAAKAARRRAAKAEKAKRRRRGAGRQIDAIRRVLDAPMPSAREGQFLDPMRVAEVEAAPVVGSAPLLSLSAKQIEEATIQDWRPENVLGELTAMSRSPDKYTRLAAQVISRHLGMKQSAEGEWKLSRIAKKRPAEYGRLFLRHHGIGKMPGCPICADLARHVGWRADQISAFIDTWLAREKARLAATNPKRFYGVS